MTALRKKADELERKGRQGDNRLIHLNDDEYAALVSILGRPTTNPETGLPEFFKFSDALKFLAPAAGAVAGSYLGGELLPGMDGAETIGGALGGALGGGATSGVTGALLGAAGGALYPNISDIAGGMNFNFGNAGPATSPEAGAMIPGGALSLSNSPEISATATPTLAAGAPTAPEFGFEYDPEQTGQVTEAAKTVQAGGAIPFYNEAGAGSEPLSGATMPMGATIGAEGGGAAAALPAATATVTGAPAAPAPAAAPQSLVQRGMNALGIKNPGSLIIPGAALAYTAMKGNEPVPRSAEIEGAANRLAASGRALESGELTPQMKQSLDASTQSAKAKIRSDYARMGLSGSSMEAQALASVDSKAAEQRSKMSLELIQTGMKQTGMAGDMYSQLSKLELEQDRELSDAIGNFVGSLGGGQQIVVRR